jgi:hypothetical protein
MVRSLSQSKSVSEDPAHLDHPAIRFYREEFLKQLESLQLQRECYSPDAVASAEQALDRILAQLDALCARHNAAEVVGRLLASFDCVTGVSCQRDCSRIN